MYLDDMLSLFIPALMLGGAFTLAAFTFQRLPPGSRFLNYHVVAYVTGLLLNLLLVLLMGVSRLVDWYVNDAMVFLAILFSGVGTTICLVVSPFTWLYRKRTGQPMSQIANYTLNICITLPYAAIALILLFYRE